MILVERPEDMASHIGAVVGPGEWVVVDQARIDAFAAATGDFHWMHNDPERAKETPTGRTIAQGLLTLSLLPALTRDMWSAAQRGGSYNYGVEGVRFITPVPVGARVRARLEIAGVERREGATRVRSRHTIEMEGQDRPVLVADTIIHIFDKELGWQRTAALPGSTN